MKCPNCSHDWTPERDEVLSEYARLGGSATSRAKTKAARANAKLGGWPKGKKRGKRKKDANQIAHGIVAEAERRSIDVPGEPKRYDHYITQQGRPPQRLKVLPSPKAPKRAR